MAEKKSDETFRVVDRRLFTAEGEVRPEALRERDEADSRPAPKAPQPAPRSAPPDAAKPAEKAREQRPSRHFQMLLGLIMRYADSVLGGLADPRTGQAVIDLDAARDLIDILDDLREKTRGNLAQQDEDLLLQVIGNLKLSYVEMEKALAQGPPGGNPAEADAATARHAAKHPRGKR